MTKRSYEKPSILKHNEGLANKFGTTSTRRTCASIEGIPVADLANEFGTPVFVFSESKIRQKYREAYQAFSVRYPKVQFAWSYKTNYLDAVCQIFHQEGSIAEVVSDMEYEMAKRLGVNGTNIIYNGPHKTKAALERAFLEGARVHLDHHDELRLVEQIAKEQNRTLDVGLRINMDTGIYPK